MAAALCLSTIVHYEARGESLQGKIAVASVVMNRVESKKFPKDVCAVMRQRGQFSFYRKGVQHQGELAFATKFLQGGYGRTVPNAYYFTNISVKFNKPVVAVIGRHRFYAQ